MTTDASEKCLESLIRTVLTGLIHDPSPSRTFFTFVGEHCITRVICRNLALPTP